LIHLHPLTLEDILQRDPREKLELFPKLGYYFISFRAIESQGARERNDVIDTLDDSGQDDGFIGAANVYMVVFKEGICAVSKLLH
jgi:magnesium transporter